MAWNLERKTRLAKNQNQDAAFKHYLHVIFRFGVIARFWVSARDQRSTPISLKEKI